MRFNRQRRRDTDDDHPTTTTTTNHPSLGIINIQLRRLYAKHNHHHQRPFKAESEEEEEPLVPLPPQTTNCPGAATKDCSASFQYIIMRGDFNISCAWKPVAHPVADMPQSEKTTASERYRQWQPKTDCFETSRRKAKLGLRDDFVLRIMQQQQERQSQRRHHQWATRNLVE